MPVKPRYVSGQTAFIVYALGLGQSSSITPRHTSFLTWTRPKIVYRNYEYLRWKCIAGSSPSCGTSASNSLPSNTSTEEVFAIDAGRDLFFSGMDEKMAIHILETPLGQLKNVEDRFIAAERLKFFPSEQSARALMLFVHQFDCSCLLNYTLEDRVARRKAIESLGRQKGAFLKQEVMNFLAECLQDCDANLVEATVWSLGEIGITAEHEMLDRVTQVLDNDHVQKRVVVQTLLRAGYAPSLPRLRKLINSEDIALACASRAAVSTMTGDDDLMKPVVSVLQSSNLNERRSAIEDITLAKYTPALKQIAICPNSLVLRARTVRVLLDSKRESAMDGEEILDIDSAKLVDRLIWDHPGDLDLLGMRKETRKSREVDRNIRQLFKNDALYSYLACKTLAEDYREPESSNTGARVLQTYKDLKYFDYFGAYHVYKTLGWLRFEGAYDLLLENASALPPRFFNHKAGAITALAELGNVNALSVIEEVAQNSTIWELKYACLIAAERLGVGDRVRNVLSYDMDWLIQKRSRMNLNFNHLNNSFPK